MSRVNTGLQRRDLTAQANEIAALKAALGVAEGPSPLAVNPTVSDERDGASGEGDAAVLGMRYGTIVVAVRKRPLIQGREDDQYDVVKCGDTGKDIGVYAPRVRVDLTPVIEPSHFAFDHVFDAATENREVYEVTTRPLLQTVREGGSAVVFAFGQTGSGKTHTMLGHGGASGVPGIYSLAVEEVFSMLGQHVRITASFYEVYGAKCFDLLNGRNEVRVMQDEYKNVHVVGIVERRVDTHDDILMLMRVGGELRSSGTTHANDRSSRSHAVLVVNLKTPAEGALYARMTFVDLAGSERASDTTDMDRKTRREGAEINKSLLALKECIRAMGMRKRHIPFRGSKLTQILKESFVGNCSTVVIANISPSKAHCEDTLNTLRYADRIKELKGEGGAELQAMPCGNCGCPIFVGDRHVCRRIVVQCQWCRESYDKERMEEHVAKCADAPAPCPHCSTRVLQGNVAQHEKRCLRLPVRCPLCESMVPREQMPKHQKDLCLNARVACRHCRANFPRAGLAEHEDACPYAQVVCPTCLMPMKRMKLESHSSECTSRGAARARGQPQTARRPSLDGPGRMVRAPSTRVVPAAGSAAQGVQQLKQQRDLSPVDNFSFTDSKLPRLPLADRLRMGGVSASADAADSTPRSAVSANGAGPLPVGRITPRDAFALRNPVPPTGGRPTPRGTGAGGPTGRAEACQHCGRRVLASSLEAHHRSDCQYAPVACSFAKYGCTDRIHRLHLTAHMQERMALHLELVVEYAERLAKENDDLRLLLSATPRLDGASSQASPALGPSLQGTPRDCTPISVASSPENDGAGVDAADLSPTRGLNPSGQTVVWVGSTVMSDAVEGT